MRIFLSILTLVLVAALLCFICWLSGYNFDHRNEAVGMMGFVICAASIGLAIGVYFSFNTGGEL